jgi:large subunit ribosomal protein L25
MTEELTVDVPLVAVGESSAITTDGGTLLHGIESVRIKALPDHLPQSIEYSIERLVDFDTTIHVSDLVIPSDVTLLTDPDEVVAKVQAPRVEIEEVPVAAEGEEAAAEGEAAEGEAGTTAAGGGTESEGGSEG